MPFPWLPYPFPSTHVPSILPYTLISVDNIQEEQPMSRGYIINQLE